MRLITPTDIAKAHSKWHDVDVPQGIRWQHSDSEFYQRISVEGAINRDLVRDFAAQNRDEIPSRRTGGYSIIRQHWGGADYWAGKLNGLFASAGSLRPEHRLEPRMIHSRPSTWSPGLQISLGQADGLGRMGASAYQQRRNGCSFMPLNSRSLSMIRLRALDCSNAARR
jgi:hypothetical protein